MDILLVAWRYLVARPITLVSMASVMVGLAAIVVVDSVMNGFLGQQRAMIRALAPDATVELAGTDGAAADRLASEIVATGVGRAVARRVEVPCLHQPTRAPPEGVGLPGVGSNYFIQLLGIDPVDERRVVDFDRFLRHDRCALSSPDAGLAAFASGGGPCHLQVARPEDPFWFDVEDPYWKGRVDADHQHRDDLIPILFGERLAIFCGYSVGSTTTLLTQKPTGSGATVAARSRIFVVVGTFQATDHHFEMTHALAPRLGPDGRRLGVVDFAGLADPVGELAVAAPAGVGPDALRDRLRSALAGRVDPGHILAWTDQKGLLLGAVENERRIMNVAMFFVVVVATFSLFMTLHQMVRLKTRDLGVLGAMGAGAGRAGQLFLVCGLLVTLAGTTLGTLAGLALTHWLNAILDLVQRVTGFRLFDTDLFAFRALPTEIDPLRISWYVGGTIVCGTLFTLLPSLRAARLDPVEALRDE